MTRQAWECLQMAIDLCLVDLDDLGHVSASSTQMNVHVLESNALQILLRRKVEEEAKFGIRKHHG